MKTLQILVLILSLSVFVLAQSSEKAVLTGSVYDPIGALIVKAKVSAINQNGEKFETVTNDEGIYIINLPLNLYNTKTANNFKVAKYEIIVDLTNQGFEKFILKNFNFVPSYKGKMNLDIALDTDNSNCGVAGCPLDVKVIEFPNLAVSNKNLQRPLEELPKENKSAKRKKGNNK